MVNESAVEGYLDHKLEYGGKWEVKSSSGLVRISVESDFPLFRGHVEEQSHRYQSHSINSWDDAQCLLNRCIVDLSSSM